MKRPAPISGMVFKLSSIHKSRQFHNLIIKYLTLSQCSDLIRPICLPLDESLRSANLVGEAALIAGWGATMFQGPQSYVLRHTQVTIASTAKCERSYKPNFPAQVFDDRIICAGASGRDSCQGDSGGPLMLLQV